jgi:hypothetical protein
MMAGALGWTIPSPEIGAAANGSKPLCPVDDPFLALPPFPARMLWRQETAAPGRGMGGDALRRIALRGGGQIDVILWRSPIPGALLQARHCGPEASQCT